jgi:hypothetical protein
MFDATENTERQKQIFKEIREVLSYINSCKDYDDLVARVKKDRVEVAHILKRARDLNLVFPIPKGMAPLEIKSRPHYAPLQEIAQSCDGVTFDEGRFTETHIGTYDGVTFRVLWPTGDEVKARHKQKKASLPYGKKRPTG